jgi:predicted ATPase
MNSDARVTRFGLRNFKAFHYLEDLEIKPLTVLVGANSSGKSSIFQALLLLKQSCEASPSSGLLKFNGDWTKLGSFADVVSNFDVSRDIEIRFETEFVVHPPENYPDEGSLHLRSEIRFAFGVEPDTGRVVLRRSSVRTSDLDSEESGGSMFVGYGGGEPIAHENLPLPIALHALTTGVSGADTDRFFLESLDWIVRYRRPGTGDMQGPAVTEKYLPIKLRASMTTLRELLEERLEYLGPVRADPRPFYPVEEDLRIGTRGEGTIPYLLRRQHDPVTYAPSPVDELREAPLLEAVNDWLGRMKVTSRLAIDPVESIAYTAAVQSTAATTRSVNLSQVGFGISQLLPVLVMALKGPRDGWLLFEQPESQLHPRLQGELGDLLLAAARAGKTVMVETHSDHLVNRLRRRIAEDETGELAKLVQILFVHAGTPDDPSSYVEQLAVDESGTILNCPADFFSETSDEAFAILNARRKRPAKASR